MLCQLSAALLTRVALSLFSGMGGQVPEPCMCSANFALVTLTLRDAKGAPIPDATVRVRRVSTNVEREASADLPGIYTIADDMLKDSVRAAGEPFEVIVRWRSRTQRVTVTVGTAEPSPATTSGKKPPATAATVCRCHVRRIAGPDQLTLR